MTPCRCLVAGVCGCKAPSRPRPSAAVRCLPRALRCACARWCPAPSRLDSGALAQPAAEQREDGGAQRRLYLSLGHFGTHTGEIGVERDVKLLSSGDGDPDNHGAAPRAAQVRGGVLRGLARDLAQRLDGRCPAGLPGWAYRIGLPAVACLVGSVTCYGIRSGGETRHAGPDLPGASQSLGPLPLRCPERRWPPAALEAVPRQALSASRALGKGVAYA